MSFIQLAHHTFTTLRPKTREILHNRSPSHGHVVSMSSFNETDGETFKIYLSKKWREVRMSSHCGAPCPVNVVDMLPSNGTEKMIPLHNVTTKKKERQVSKTSQCREPCPCHPTCLLKFKFLWVAPGSSLSNLVAIGINTKAWLAAVWWSQLNTFSKCFLHLASKSHTILQSDFFQHLPMIITSISSDSTTSSRSHWLVFACH